jgi:hypothetical protein
MDGPSGPLLSVRGDARQTVAPDYEHIADTGLLGGGSEGERFRFTSSSRVALAAQGGGEEADAPSLDPVPQELTATIEARFVATGVSLAEH